MSVLEAMKSPCPGVDECLHRDEACFYRDEECFPGEDEHLRARMSDGECQ